MLSLLNSGKIVKQPWMTTMEKKDIDNIKGIHFILKYIASTKVKSKGDKILVIRAGTSSGKSTVIVPELYKKFKRNIICTQPSIATTIEIPSQIVFWNKDLKLGENIGYQTGALSRRVRKGILFATIGILLQQLKSMDDEAIMRRYGFIMIDEAHERSLIVDQTIYYLKKFIDRNWKKDNCPLIILMSATLSPEVFLNYFNAKKNRFIDVLGRAYPIKENFFDYSLSNYLTYARDLVEKIHLDNLDDGDFRDILVFLQGKSQIKQLQHELLQLNKKVFSQGLEFSKKDIEEKWKKYLGGGTTPLYIMPVIAMSETIQAGGKDYQNMFSDISAVKVQINDKPHNVFRRVILGSNAIETGITIDTLKYCIDLGWVKQSSFDPNLQCTVLIDQPITKASSMQRRGRVGRKAPGEFYAAYSKETYEKMNDLPYPEIVTTDISEFMLAAIISETNATEKYTTTKTNHSYIKNTFDESTYYIDTDSKFDFKKLTLLQYPGADALIGSINLLCKLGFITVKNDSYIPTLFGYYANKMRKISLQNIRMILAGFHEKANILDLITIASALEIRGIKTRKYIQNNDLDDFIEFLFIFHDLQQCKTLTDVEAYTITHKLNFFKVLDWIDRRDEFIADFANLGLNFKYSSLNITHGTIYVYNKQNIHEGMEEIQKIRQCIYEGYKENLIKYCYKKKTHIWEKNQVPVYLPDEYKRYSLLISDSILLMNYLGRYRFVPGSISIMDDAQIF